VCFPSFKIEDIRWGFFIAVIFVRPIRVQNTIFILLYWCPCLVVYTGIIVDIITASKPKLVLKIMLFAVA
jgi:hypothetical protein